MAVVPELIGKIDSGIVHFNSAWFFAEIYQPDRRTRYTKADADFRAVGPVPEVFAQLLCDVFVVFMTAIKSNFIAQQAAGNPQKRLVNCLTHNGQKCLLSSVELDVQFGKIMQNQAGLGCRGEIGIQPDIF